MMNLDDVTFNPKDSACINYVKARIAIEESMPNREQKRAAKMVVIEHLGGSIHHPTPAEIKHGAQKVVLFKDSTKARF